MSIRQIAKRLTQAGHCPPRGGKVWGETTAQKILHNEAYIGTLYYNRSHSVPLAPGERSFGQRKAIKNKLIIRPREEWISVSIPSIIERETFQRSQARHEPNRQFSPRRLKEERWLLRGLVHCAKCKHKHACVANRRCPHMPPAFYYRCGKPGTLREYVHCRPNHLRSEPLDELVWQEVKRHLLDPQLLLRAHKQLKEEPREESFLEAQIQAARRRLQQAEGERRRLLDAFQGGFLQKQEFEERARKLAERIAGLEVDLKGLQAEEQKSLGGKYLLSRIADFTQVVRKKLDTMSFQERQALARTVLEEVLVDGHEVHLHFRIPLVKRPEEPTQETENRPERNVSRGFDLRSRRGEGMAVGVKICERPERLRRGDHGRDGLLKRWELRLEELERGGVSRAAEISVEVAIPEELLSKHLWDGENQLHIGNVGKHVLDHSLGPENGALGPASGAQTSTFKRRGGSTRSLRSSLD
jgi:hypothetical protein